MFRGAFEIRSIEPTETNRRTELENLIRDATPVEGEEATPRMGDSPRPALGIEVHVAKPDQPSRSLPVDAEIRMPNRPAAVIDPGPLLEVLQLERPCPAGPTVSTAAEVS